VTSRFRQGICLLVLALCASCVSALREAPTVESLTGPPGHHPDALAELLEQASALLDERTLESMRAAAAKYLEAAAVDRSRAESWVGACRAQVWLSGMESAADEREAMALAAVQSAQLCSSQSNALALCKYWLAVGLGVQARERRATALDALPRMVQLLEQSAAADPTIDRAGPHRVLALVLARAPGWPTGPGDAERALEEARRAMQADPSFVPNQLCLAETLAGVDLAEQSREILAAAEKRVREQVALGDREAAEWLAEIEVARASGWAR